MEEKPNKQKVISQEMGYWDATYRDLNGEEPDGHKTGREVIRQVLRYCQEKKIAGSLFGATVINDNSEWIRLADLEAFLNG